MITSHHLLGPAAFFRKLPRLVAHYPLLRPQGHPENITMKMFGNDKQRMLV